MPPRARRAAGSSAAAASSSSTALSAPAASASHVTARASARLGLLSGVIEGTLALMELMVGMALSRMVCVFIYQTLNGMEKDQQPPAWNLFCIHVVSNLVVLAWQVFRLSQKSQPVCDVPTMAKRLNLWPLPRRLHPDTVRLLLLVLALHAVGTAGMFLAQYLSGDWLFSWKNYWTEEKGWDYNNVCDMLLFAPLREEMTFRGVMFSIFYLRGAAFKLAPPVAPAGSPSRSSAAPAVVPLASQESLAWSSSWKLDCVLASAVTFGLVHLLNVFGRYTRTYIVLQVLLGCTLGAFYCFRLVLSEHAVLETILLHIINNVFSSFLPIDAELDLSNPLVSFPLLLTFVVYGSLGYVQYRQLMALPAHPFRVLLPTDVPTEERGSARDVQPQAQPQAQAVETLTTETAEAAAAAHAPAAQQLQEDVQS